jgi:hypothetical protein
MDVVPRCKAIMLVMAVVMCPTISEYSFVLIMDDDGIIAWTWNNMLEPVP